MASPALVRAQTMTAAERSASTLVLDAGEPLFVTDTNELFYGDGTTQVQSLTAIGGGGSGGATSGPDGNIVEITTSTYDVTAADFNNKRLLLCNTASSGGSGSNITINVPDLTSELASDKHHVVFVRKKSPNNAVLFTRASGVYGISYTENDAGQELNRLVEDEGGCAIQIAEAQVRIISGDMERL